MMEDIIIGTIAILILISIPCGLLYLLYKGIRSLIDRQFLSAFWFLLLPLFVLCLVFPTMLPNYVNPHEKARRVCCSQDLRAIVNFRIFTISDNESNYPATFNDMVGDHRSAGDLDVREFVCPSSKWQIGSSTDIHAWTSFAYVSGVLKSDPTNCVRAFCIPDNHRGAGANVAFNSGDVVWFSCKPTKDSNGDIQPTFQELTNTPSLFYGTTNETQLADMMKRTKIIYPKTGKR